MKILSVRFSGWAGLFYNSNDDHETNVYFILSSICNIAKQLC